MELTSQHTYYSITDFTIARPYIMGLQIESLKFIKQFGFGLNELFSLHIYHKIDFICPNTIYATTMFRLIPLRIATQSAIHRIDTAMPLHDVVEREIYAPNYTTPGHIHAHIPDTTMSMSWNMYPTKSNLLMITSGKVELDIYSLHERNQQSFVLTPENVYRNGKVYYGSPAMLGWAPGIFYKLRIGSSGASFVNFIKYHDKEGKVNEETATEYMVV